MRRRRDAVTATGADATSYLHGQLSQDVTTMADGESRWTFVLQPTGRVDVLARIRRVDADSYVLDTDVGYGDELQARLDRFKIRVDVTLAREALDTFIVLDPGIDRGGDLVGFEGVTVWLVAPGDGVEVGDEELEEARVAAGWPAMGSEIVPGETIPAETGITAVAVDFRKGCYPGQELVERMDSRGASAPRRLVVVDVLPGAAAGDPIVHDGADVGVLTTVVGARALGYVKRNVEI